MNVVFDFDGTLVDSFEALYGLNSTVAKTLLNRDLSRDQYRISFNGSIHKELARILTLTPEEDKTFRDGKKYAFNAHYSPTTIRLHNELIPILKILNHHTLSILTAAPKEVVWWILRSYGIDGFFSRVSNTDEFSKREVLSLMSRPTVFVTDTVGDVIEGKKAGVRVIGVTWGFHEGKALYAAGADTLVSNMNEIPLAI